MEGCQGLQAGCITKAWGMALYPLTGQSEPALSKYYLSPTLQSHRVQIFISIFIISTMLCMNIL